MPAVDHATTPTVLQRAERRIVDAMARQHLERLREARPNSRAPLFWWRLLALLVALPVHAVSVLCLVGGMVLLTGDGAWPMRFLGGFLVVGAVLTRPRLGSRPEHVAALTRAQAPSLFALLDAVARANQAPVPHEVLITAEFNAFAASVGWRRTRVLGLGAALWVPATPQARVAYVGHELGHLAHGDLRHGWWVGGARCTMLHWFDLAGGRPLVTSPEMVFVQEYVLAPVRGLIAAYFVLLTWIDAAAGQRAEYLADLDSAAAAGTDGALAALELLMIEGTVSTAIIRAALHPERPDPWQVLSEAMSALTPESLEQRRMRASAERSRIDDTHPATPLRIALIQARPPEQPAVTLDPAALAAIDAELAAALTAAGHEAAELVRDQR